VWGEEFDAGLKRAVVPRRTGAAEHPLTTLDAGQGVYDISFSTLDQLHNYSVFPFTNPKPQPLNPKP